MHNKLNIVFGIICVLFVVLIIRLSYIEFSSGKKYEKIVLSQQQYDSQIIPFQRGDIVDSKGTVLATSVDVYNVILDCKVLNANEDAKDATIAAVTECFPEIQKEVLVDKLENQKDSQYVILAKHVSYEEMAAYEAKRVESENQKDAVALKGIWFEKEYQRVYPYGSLAASVIGFTTAGNEGVIGLENYYNQKLNGINGRTYGYLNADNNMEKTVVEPENGSTLVTTIDANIQGIVEQEILNFNAAYTNENGLGSKNTAMIVMDPNSGEILAMADYPGFDLNQPRNLTGIYKPEELEGLDETQLLELLDPLWQNYCVSSTYEPGSTYKTFTVAAGIDMGALTGAETYLCDGYETFAGGRIKCNVHSGHGLLDMEGVMMMSCNDALMQMGYVIGPQRFYQYQCQFGFGQKTGIDLPGEVSTSTLVYDEKGLESDVNLATNTFGQNVNVTMVQLASAFSSVVNGGKYYQPHMVKRVLDENGNTIEEISPVVMKQTIAKETTEQMKPYLRAVVERGTAKMVKVDGYDIGGKTGTAEKYPRGQGTYLCSFIGCVPVEDPQLVVYCIVDEPNAQEQDHSTYAQGIVHNVLQQILPYLNIPRITQ